MAQQPTRVDGVSRATIAERIVADLQDCDNVEEAYTSPHNKELVRVKVSRSNLPADVMRVCGDHDASYGGICLETDASFQEAHIHPPR